MMTGIPNVNRIYLLYRAVTLVFLLCLGIYDAKHHLIRNAALFSFCCWCLLSIPAKYFCGINISLSSLVFAAILGAVCGLFLFLSIAVATDSGIGGGDIKLVTLLGFYYGASGLYLVLISSCIMVLFVILLCRILFRSKPKSVPFAPFLFLGCFFYELSLF